MKRLLFYAALFFMSDIFPSNSRSCLEAAQAYKAQQNYEKAIEIYRAVIEQGGSEESWFSTLMIGACYEADNQWHHALFWYLDAYQMRPDRPDPLCKIATHYRLAGQSDLAHLFAQYGIRIPQQEFEYISEFPPLRDYQFDEELSIAAYYTRFRDDGYKAVSDLMIRKNIPGFVKEQAGKNLLFYVQNLKNARFKSLAIELPLIREGAEERYLPMSPSIVSTENGYLMTVRGVNFIRTGPNTGHAFDSNGVYRSKTFLISFDSSFNVLSQKEIVEELPRQKYGFFPRNEGLEDCRFFSWNGDFYFTCTTIDTHPRGMAQISLCHLDMSNDDVIRVDQLVPLIGPDPNRYEKNWLPFIHNGQLRIVYSCNPLILYEPNFLNGECATVFSSFSDCDFSEFKGSAPPIAFDRGYLMLIHETISNPGAASACYTHRFVYLDADMNIAQVSKPFVFQYQGLEYCCGMCLDPQGKELIMSIAREEREVALCFVDVETVCASLGPLPRHCNRDMQNDQQFYSQASQDRFIYTILNRLLGKRDAGYYLEIGASEPILNSNTYFFEKNFQWKGVSIDISNEFENAWSSSRKNPLLIEDAMQADYKSILQSFPRVIDYLSLDVDECYDMVLQRLPFDDHIFKMITIEHDAYRYGDVFRQKEREILTSLGYKLLCSNVLIEGLAFEDWWIYPDQFPASIFATLTSLDLNGKDHAQIVQTIERCCLRQ